MYSTCRSCSVSEHATKTNAKNKCDTHWIWFILVAYNDVLWYTSSAGEKALMT